jgi:hypothetical protein
VKEHLHQTKLVSFGKILTQPKIEQWRAHCPENERQELFQTEVTKYLQMKYEDKVFAQQ